MSHSTPSPSTRPTRPTGAVDVGVTSPAEPVDPTVPLALWLTPTDPAPAPGGAAQAVPVLLAQNLVAVYTGPTGTVLAAGGSAHLLARTAARLGRRPAPRTAGHRPAAGSVDLLVLTPPTAGPTASPAVEGRTPGPDGAAWRRWTRLLSPAGVLAVVLPESRGPSDPAMVVAAAVGAGLTYLQHIPALTWPLHDDHFDPPANVASAHGGEPHRSEPGQRAEAGAVRTAHLDVLIFGRRTGHTAADHRPSNLTDPVDPDAPDLDAPDLDTPDLDAPERDSRTHPAAVPHGATAPEGIR